MQSNEIINLVSISNNKLILNQEGILKLKQLKGKIFPICCIGPILTGKSEFLNLITGKNIFPTSSTTMPKTKGINAYIEEVVNERAERSEKADRGGVWKVYIDVQGFDDSFNDGSQDVDRSLLMVLLVSCKLVFYHSFGALQSIIFQRLASLRNKLPQKLQNRPQAIFLQKDFSLKLTNKDHQPMTQQQYLIYCMKNFKSKDTISNLDGLFEKLNCFTLSHPADKDRFAKGISYVKSFIQQKFLDFNFSRPEQFQTTNFIYNFMKSVELINPKNNLQKIYQQSRKQKHEQSKNWLALYKSNTNQKIKNQIKPNLPIPSQLLMFQLKNIFKECSSNLGSYGKVQQNFIVQTIGQDIMFEFQNKIVGKLSGENQGKIREFVVKKVEQFMQEYRNQELSQSKIERIDNQIIEKLRNYYSFITDSHRDFIKSNIYSQVIKIFLEKNTQKLNKSEKDKKKQQNIILQKQNIISSLQQSLQKSQKSQEDQAQNTKKQLQLRQEKIKQLQQNLDEIKRQNFQLVLKQQQTQNRIAQTQKQMQKYHQTMKNNAQHGQNLLKQIQTNLKQNLIYQKKPKTLTQSQSQQTQSKQSTKIILTSINKIFELIKNSNQDTKDQQKRQYQQIINLQRMNKNLRQRIEQLMGNSCVDVVQRKYVEAENQLKQKQKFIQILAAEKEVIIEKLRTEIRYHNQTIKSLQFQLELSRSRATDKSKTSEFMQKLIQTKQNLLEQARMEMLENLTKYKEEVNNVRSQYRKKQLELSDTVSMFAVKNEQLTNKNNELSGKLATLEKKLKKQYQEKLYEKDNEIAKLSENLNSFETNLMKTTDGYTQVTSQMEKMIKQKDESIFELTLTVQRLQDKTKTLTHTLQNLSQKYEETKQNAHRLELQKQQIQSKSKREQILNSNRLKHLEQLNDKLKSQMKQKQSTFEMMLLQLRSQSIINNNNQRSNSMLRQNSRQKYIRRIDQIQEIAMKELDEISNKDSKRGVSTLKKPQISTKPPKQEPQPSDENYLRTSCCTDKKKPLRLSYEYSDSKISTLGTYNPNTSGVMFKMLSKRL